MAERSGFLSENGGLVVPTSEDLTIMRARGIGQRALLQGNPGVTSIAEQLGEPDANVPGGSVLQDPEQASALVGLVDPVAWHRSSLNVLPSVIPLTGGNVVFTAMDYSTVVGMQAFRAAVDTVTCLGRNDQTRYIGTNSSGSFSFAEPAQANLLLGVSVFWSVTALNFASFEMTLTTSRFWGKSYQSVDRTFSVRLGTDGVPNGSFAVLFAQRLLASQTCGYGAPTAHTASGGMSRAIVQPAFVVPNFNSTTEVASFPHLIPGAAINGPADVPAISITVPSSIGANASIELRFLSAGSPALNDVVTRVLSAGQRNNAQRVGMAAAYIAGQ